MSDTIFGKIISGEIPSEFIHEDEHCVAIHDINPQAPVHVLVIPRGPYVSMDDFTESASDAEIAGFWRALGETARTLGLVEGGYRVLANHGSDSHQEVMHLHVHIFAGRPLGPMLEGGALPPDGRYTRG